MAEKEICGIKARYRFTWPGKDESTICDAHVSWLKRITEAMGLHLQLISIDEDSEKVCQQIKL